MNGDHRMACMGLKDSSLSRWVVASQDVCTQHQTQSPVLALQAQMTDMMEAITLALATKGQGSSRPLLKRTCFNCGHKGHFKTPPLQTDQEGLSLP